MKSLRTQLVVLLALVALTFAVRLRGLSYQVPQWTYWDGYVLFDQTAYLRGESTPALPHRTLATTRT